MKRFAVVMAGGSGERFWPMSKPGRPKQMLRLTRPDQTMLDEAVTRAEPLVGADQVLIATSVALRDPFISAGYAADQVVAEPAKRNTLGCLCWVAATLVARGHEDATVGVLTADHRIEDPELFRTNCQTAFEIAEQKGGIVTLGIQPTRAETGFGYIEADTASEFATESGSGQKAVRFLEKPDLETANKFLAAGNYLWNGGMFFFTLGSFLGELESSQPDSRVIVDEIATALKAGDEDGAKVAFEKLPNISVDFAVMERAKSVYVVRAEFAWDDVGSWDAMERSRPADENNNVVEGRVAMVDTEGSILWNTIPDIAVGVVGLKDIIVIATPDGILVCPKSEAQKVRAVSIKVREL
ncbi:MAG: mannose-1-phosphate guanylyltransferase [Fimbriimonas sp.]